MLEALRRDPVRDTSRLVAALGEGNAYQVGAALVAIGRLTPSVGRPGADA
ncbi:hypothetical protein [Streptomyces sp. NPDC049906]